MASNTGAEACPPPPSITIELHTGGAQGADRLFAQLALGAGHTVRVFTFDTHAAIAPPGSSVAVLTPAQLAKADPCLEAVARRLRRSVGSTLYTRNLLRRNWHLVQGQGQGIKALYAVGSFEKGRNPGSSGSPTLGIAGGTAWACQIFAERQPELGLLPLYFFSQEDKAWFQCRQAKRLHFGWEPVTPLPPRPHTLGGSYVGIGSRDLDLAGHAAIRSLFSP